MGVVGALLGSPGVVAGQDVVTQDEALRLAFGEAAIERRTAFLDEAAIDRLRAAMGPGGEIANPVVSYYVARDQGGDPLGIAYFDVHRVRTLREVLMIVVSPAGRITRIEVLKFAEPPDYRAPEEWLAQFRDRALTDDLSLSGDIATMTGATLTARAVTAAARRILALHAELDPFGEAAAP